MNNIRSYYSGLKNSLYSNNRMTGNSASLRSIYNTQDVKKNNSFINNKSSAGAKNTNKSGQGTEIITYTDKEGRTHKTFIGKGTDVVETMREAVRTTNNDEVKVKKRLNYSYQKVSSMVIMAKTSVSASKAVLAARRSLSDLKRKLKNSDCSDEEKEAALTHASRMIRVAYKKKKNLELEELVEKTMDADEREENSENVGEEISLDNEWDTSGEEDEGSDNLEDGLDEYGNNELEICGDEYSEVVGELTEENFDVNDSLGASEEIISEDDIGELMDEFISEMNEEINELLDAMEIVNPHMDEEHFKKLKTKHRCDEQKDIVKADMDYLKSMSYLGSAASSAGGFDFSL